jgi:hypothetical protein
MPNHVQSIITISGTKESVERVKNRILVNEDYIWNIKTRNTRVGDKNFSLPIPKLGTLSFNRLIPTPENIFQGDLGIEDEQKYGKDNCWYYWRINNWGTKWDAYDVEIQMYDDDVIGIMFQTAWNAPLPYMKELAKVCVEEGCEMSGKFSDEDFGSNMGIYYINEDKEFAVEWHEDDAELYEECWGWNPLENNDEFDDVDDEDENN